MAFFIGVQRMSLTRKQREARSYFVYFLRCPDTGTVMYVGSTSCPVSRESGHLNVSAENNPKADWVRSLKSQGKRFILDVVIGPMPYQKALDCERRLIFLHSKCVPVAILNQSISSWPPESTTVEQLERLVAVLQSENAQLRAELEASTVSGGAV